VDLAEAMEDSNHHFLAVAVAVELAVIVVLEVKVGLVTEMQP
jgi:hypothetical protein